MFTNKYGQKICKHSALDFAHSIEKSNLSDEELNNLTKTKMYHSVCEEPYYVINGIETCSTHTAISLSN